MLRLVREMVNVKWFFKRIMLRQTIIDIFVNEDNRNREGWNPLDTQQRQNLSLQRIYSTVLHYREQTNENYISKTVYMYGIASA